ncbi:MAG: hypothetical protein LBU74_00065 [Methanobacteriaceae archaeon]|nr:hypothetical protein [Candidatus Methanorudis spinitermitis]
MIYILVMQKQKIKTTMNIEVDIFEKLKSLAKDNGTTQTKMMNNLLKKGLLLEEQEKKQKKTKGDNFIKLAGIVTAQNPFNATEEVKKFRNGEL